jgi:hypothetical protein
MDFWLPTPRRAVLPKILVARKTLGAEFICDPAIRQSSWVRWIQLYHNHIIWWRPWIRREIGAKIRYGSIYIHYALDLRTVSVAGKKWPGRVLQTKGMPYFMVNSLSHC